MALENGDEGRARGAVAAMLARRERGFVPVHDRPGELVGRQIRVEPRSLHRTGPLGVQRDEVNVAPVVRVPAFDTIRSAVLGQDEHFPEGRRIRGVVLVVAAGREDGEVLEVVGVDPEEALLEGGTRAPVVRDVAGVNHEIEGNGRHLIAQRRLVVAAATGVAERDEPNGCAAACGGRRPEAQPVGRGAPRLDVVTVDGVGHERRDGRQPLRGAGPEGRAGILRRQRARQDASTDRRHDDREVGIGGRHPGELGGAGTDALKVGRSLERVPRRRGRSFAAGLREREAPVAAFGRSVGEVARSSRAELSGDIRSDPAGACADR